ncbi:methyltransferase domain-containing protein [Stappia indica]|uniref:methyltransferase domain-containing protein n=1 Tax=Stappia indica TaxID=538381 RepID=UPI001CD7918F|nr:methyltransferase domain-containing protein [Stappia indica]MCA1298591.1 methyltransferase domain-containing protein [Stappia indica]
MTLGDGLGAGNGSWTFAGNVHKVFDQHVSKSVPLYTESHEVGVQMSDFFIHEGSVVYDIGCSTGTLLRKLATYHKGKNVRFVGIDPVPDMIADARERSRDFDNIEYVVADVVDFDFLKADLILSYYTLQFVLPKHRQEVFDKIFSSLNWGGGLILFEKMRFPDARFQDITMQLYQEFKLMNGYSATDIIGKSRSLKGVLEPFSEAANRDLMSRAGFTDMTSIMRYLSFVGYLAIK